MDAMRLCARLKRVVVFRKEYVTPMATPNYMITLAGHFDGTQIQLDEPFDLPANARLLITVLRDSAAEDERAGWRTLSRLGLAQVYGVEEPEYGAAMIRETNPDYEAG